MARGRSSFEISSNESIITLSYLYDIYLKSQAEYDLYNQDYYENENNYKVAHLLSIPSSKREIVEIAAFFSCPLVNVNYYFLSTTIISPVLFYSCKG